jgi:hypothetical protein
MSNAIVGVVPVLIVISVVLLIGGMALRRHGHLRSRGAALVWAILIVLPVFGSGLALYITHDVERARGITQPGRDTPRGVVAP